jgi:hypothetical protein
MDQAWKLEQSFWEESRTGNAAAFFRRHMIAEGYVVFPNGIVTRDELISKWDDRSPLRGYELTEPRFTLVDGSTLVISYGVRTDAEWLPNYAALMTAVYTWEGTGWALAVRTHTPTAAAFPF